MSEPSQQQPDDSRSPGEIAPTPGPGERSTGPTPEGFPVRRPEELRLSPELREWARQQFTEEEIVAGLQELREKGGLELEEFLHELEKAAGPAGQG
jgi:hypothetical protein